MAQDTNLNITPYFDDYDTDKNYHRILFRPSFPIQARELTQLQTILQDQIERFGQNIYKIGTVISGCALLPEPQYNYIKFNDIDTNNLDVNIASFQNCIVTYQTTGLRALITNVVDGLQTNANGDLKTAYVKYITAGSDQTEYAFANGATVLVQKTNTPIEDVVIDSAGAGYTNSMYINILQTSPAQIVNAYARIVSGTNGSIVDVTLINAGEGYTKSPASLTYTITYANGTAVPVATANGANLSFINYISQPIVNSTGVGYGLRVSDGIIFQKGFFIRSEAQEIVVSKYSSTSSGQPNNVVVGFTTQESIVNSAVDETLLDNASGFTNYQAPGAHRLKLTPTLALKTTSELTETTEGVPPVENFFVLAEFQNGRIVRDKTATQFNAVDTELARRTFEESGDYVLDQITLDTEDASEIFSNTTTYGNTINIIVGKGVSYVQGRRNELKNPYRVNVPKSNTTITRNNQSISTSYESYLQIQNYNWLGTTDIQAGELVNLYGRTFLDNYPTRGGTLTFQPGITRIYPGSVIPSDLSTTDLCGAPVGTARIRNIEYVYGGSFIRVYLFDVKINSGSSGEFHVIGKNNKFIAVNFLPFTYDFYGVENENIVFNAGLSAVSTISDEQFDYRNYWSDQTVSSGTATVATPSTDITYLYDGALTDPQKEDYFIISKNDIVSANLSGHVNVSSNGQLTILSGTISQSDFPRIYGDGTTSFYIKVINSANAAQSFFTRAYTVYGNTIYTDLYSVPSNYQYAAANVAYAFPNNSVITPGMVNITVSSSTSAAISFKYGTWSGTANIDVVATVTAQDAQLSYTTFASNTFYVKVDQSVANTLPNGPWCIGVPNVYRIDGVWIGSGNTFANTSLAVNQKDSFILDNGQKDSLYGLAYLKAKPGSSLSLTGKNILIQASCFKETVAGDYISAESYSGAANVELIPVFTTRQGEVISLRDAVDFRPIVSNTVSLQQSVATANIINAASYSTFTTETLTISNKKFPAPAGSFRGDIVHFVPRRDRITVDKDGNIKAVQGIPSVVPELPGVPDGVMVLGDVYIPAYPSLPYYRAQEVNRLDYAIQTDFKQQRRYTMKDIQKIEDRIDTLEYYTSLNLLESKTQGLSIVSDNDATLERFKYGFLVDPMKDSTISNNSFINVTFEIDSFNEYATPRFDRLPLKLKVSSSSSVNVFTVLPDERKPGKVAMLGASSTVNSANFIHPTKQRNLVEGFIKFSGSMSVIPPVDTSIVQDPNRVILRTPSQDRDPDVSDLRFNQYIRQQRVYLRCTSLMPNRRHYIFFDGVSMGSRSRTANFFANGAAVGTGALGASLITDQYGQLNIEMNIPADTFIVGEREIIVTDVDNLKSENASVSIAKEEFSGFGATIPTIQIYDPLAQTFKVQKSQTGGKFVKQVNVLFARKPGSQSTPPEAGVKLEIRKTVNGYPTGAEGIIATKHLPASNVNVLASNSTIVNTALYTTFTFNDPVFIEGDVEYALVLKPDGNSPDYLAWVGKVGEQVLATNQQYTTQDGTPGVLFQSTNDSAWSPVQAEDLVYTVRTIRFDYLTGSVTLIPRDYEFITYVTKQNKSFDFQVSESIGQLNGVYCDGVLAMTGAIINGHTPSGTNSQFISFTPAGNTHHTLTAITGSANISQFALNTNTGLNADQGIIVLRIEPHMVSQLNADCRFEISSGSANLVASNISTANIAEGNSNPVRVGDFVVISTAAHSNAFSTQTAANTSVIRQVVSITSNTEFVVDAPILSASVSNVSVWVANNVKSFMSTVYSANGTHIVLNNPVPTEFATSNTGVAGTTNVAISVVKAPIATIIENDTLKNKLKLEDSSASISTGIKFNSSNATFLGTLISSTYSNSTVFTTHLANTASVDNISVDEVSGIIDTVVPTGTSITTSLTTNYRASGASTTQKTIDLSGQKITPINHDAVLRSRSNQTSDSTPSISLVATLRSAENDCSPRMLVDPASLIIGNALISNNVTNEISANGAALAKYISKAATLKEDVNAEDIFVYITAYRPINTNIKAYVKLLSRTDSKTLESVDWTELVIDTNENLYSSSTNPGDYKEYRFVPRTRPLTTELGGGAVYTTITTYANTGANTTFNSNTGVNSTDDFITLTPQPFSTNNLVQYLVSTGNTAVTGLSNAAYYYVISANSTGVKLATTLGGTAVNITATTASETGHTLVAVAANVVANVIGTSTTWDTSGTGQLVANDVVVISDGQGSTTYDVGVVQSVTNNTLIVLKSPLTQYENGDAVTVEKMTYPKQAFRYQGNQNIIRYFDGTLASHDTFYQYAVKLVMTRDANGVVPKIDDLRVIATSV